MVSGAVTPVRRVRRQGLAAEGRGTGQPYRFDWDTSFGHVHAASASGLVDFTHPEAFADWRDRHQALFDLGVDVIKADFGEQVPDHVVGANGDAGRRLHNVYPLLYSACVFEATARARGQGFVFARSGWSGSQRYPGHWGGDPQSDWEGLAASLRGALSWGLSGGACYATDIGGFYGPQPDAELFVRWTQAAVFASHIRFHGIGPREPWIFGDRVEAIVRDWLTLRYRLIPYLEGCLAEAERTGLPPMRAMPLAFPDQPESWAFDTQYLFGPDLLVAPILRPGGGRGSTCRVAAGTASRKARASMAGACSSSAVPSRSSRCSPAPLPRSRSAPRSSTPASSPQGGRSKPCFGSAPRVGSRAVERIEGLGAAHAPKGVAADRDQPLGRGRGRLGEGLGNQEVALVLATEPLDPRCLVDRRSDHREVEPIGAADVAVEHVAEMQGDVELHDRLAGGGALDVQIAHTAQRLAGSVERALTGRRGGMILERKGGEQAVAQEFQHIAAAFDQNRHHAVEIGVQHVARARRARVDRPSP